MMDLGAIITLLEGERIAVAVEAMERSNGSDAVLRQAVGIYAGLQRAQNAIEKLHEDEEDRQANL